MQLPKVLLCILAVLLHLAQDKHSSVGTSLYFDAALCHLQGLAVRTEVQTHLAIVNVTVHASHFHAWAR